MSAMATLSSWPRSNWQRAVIALIAVPAILVGLLAMHFLASETMAPESHSIGVSSAESPMVLGTHNDVPATAECGTTCGPAHDMLAMACVLILLISVAFVMLPALLSQIRMTGASVQVIAARLRALAPLSPPSLHVLSISRT